VTFRAKDDVLWGAGVVVTVLKKTEQTDFETYDIVLLADGFKVTDVEGVANHLKDREVCVSYRSGEDEAWKYGVVINHHLGTDDVAATFDLRLEDGKEVKDVAEGRNLMYGTVNENTALGTI
jgi:hypothetical protein